MLLKKLKNTSNGTRHQLILSKNFLFKYTHFIKNLTLGLSLKSGRGKNGKISVRHKGGRLFKTFYKPIFNLEFSFVAIVLGILYNSNTSAFISLNFDFLRKTFFYGPSTHKVNCGSIITNNIVSNESRLGFRNYISKIPTGSLIHDLSYKSNFRAIFIRSAGSFGQILQKKLSNANIKLPSKLILNINVLESATIGRTSNVLYNKIIYGKAGKKRNIGIRPSVRGIAMNPVDHPHGGRTNGGRPSVTPWGLPTKGVPTVKK
jgi:large subunit ribosomal protein L2